MTGPVRHALGGSSLARDVKPGLQAVASQHLKYLDDPVRNRFADSIDLDEATRGAYPNDPRWDYLLGDHESSRIVGVEVHSAETSEVSRVIAKKNSSRQHLARMAPEARVDAWYWLATNGVHFVPHEKSKLRLSENGIDVRGRLLVSDLNGAATHAAPSKRKRR